MNKSDFDFSKYVHVPDEWIENALSIPTAAAQKPKVIRFQRRYVAAASIIPIALIGISLYFLLGNIKAPPIAPKPTYPIAETQAVTEASGETAVTSSTEPTAPADTSVQPSKPAPTAVATQLSTDSEGNIIVITTITTHGTDPTTPPATSPTGSHQAPTAPSPTDAPHPKPTQAPTDKPAPKPTAAPEPTSEPTPPPVQPTQEPEPAIEERPKQAEIIVPISEIEFISTETDEKDELYCRVYDNQGRILGDSDPYAPSHLVDVIVGTAGENQPESAMYAYSFEYLPSQVSGTVRYEFYIRINGSYSSYVVYSGTIII